MPRTANWLKPDESQPDPRARDSFFEHDRAFDSDNADHPVTVESTTYMLRVRLLPQSGVQRPRRLFRARKQTGRVYRCAMSGSSDHRATAPSPTRGARHRHRAADDVTPYNPSAVAPEPTVR
ncbi:hypothetical protein HPB47_022785 [Ixodes persulcatus]|uniref:Uncharacterized protein n=1 Tax=Ixodes persulcatus TaxID=34615 RepID=A0AC60Q8T4_IXOPE|nr:hypothetical protein HPB47_022785 [Ixodes persulcatus]